MGADYAMNPPSWEEEFTWAKGKFDQLLSKLKECDDKVEFWKERRRRVRAELVRVAREIEP